MIRNVHRLKPALVENARTHAYLSNVGLMLNAQFEITEQNAHVYLDIKEILMIDVGNTNASLIPIVLRR